MSKNKKDINDYLRNHLSEFRYSHSLRVAEEAKRLAKIYHIDEEKAYLVGLAHDVAHELNKEQNLFWIKRYHLSNSLLEDSYQNILHSDIGSLIAKELFLFDKEMCQAIQYHTIGNIHMNTFDKVIFLADKIGRKNLDITMKKVQDLTNMGCLNEALIMYFEILKESLKSRGLSLHSNSLELVNSLRHSNR